ncbi:MAG: type IV pilus assembly protein PilN [Gammaproteobacteria bacterium]|jgi:type IV pilus assembly protein PilN
MAKINLLPWREALRKEKQKEFGMLMGFGAALAAVVVILVHLYYSQKIEAQQGRNTFMVGQISFLDKKIEEIKQLENEKQKLLARMRAIEQLQGNRPLIVRFFDELVRSLPEGVSVKNISQNGRSITIDGEAQSNARVSSFMRKLESSLWLQSPQLDIIQVTNANDVRISSFKMRFNQVIPKTGEEEDI